MRSVLSRLLIASLFGLALGAARATPFELVVPAYFLPQLQADGSLAGGSDWAALAAASGQGLRVTAILNPNSGPGTLPPPANWATAAASFRCERCENLLGFTSTNYGRRPIDEVKAEIAAYYRYYPVNGIFLDEMPGEFEMLGPGGGVGSVYWNQRMAYYSELYAYIHSLGGAGGARVMGNPGTRTVEAFLTGDGHYGPAADSLMVFENRQEVLLHASGFDAYVPTPWSSTGAYRDQLGYIVHSTSAGLLTQVVDQIVANGGGIAYVTDGGFVGADDRRYTQLPGYWNTLVGLAEVCEVPSPGTGALLAGGLGLIFLGRRRAHRLKNRV